MGRLKDKADESSFALGCLVCVYGPKDDRENAEKEGFWVDLEVYLDKFERSERIMLTGDVKFMKLKKTGGSAAITEGKVC